jgi:phosphatidylinositol-4,5-bisphosphate 4-phosphatase
MLSSIHFPVRSYSLEALQPDAGAKSATLMLVKYEKSPPKDEQKGPEKAPGGEIPQGTARSFGALKEIEQGKLNSAEFVMDNLKLDKRGLLSLPVLLNTSDNAERASTKQERSSINKLSGHLIKHIAVKHASKNKISLKESVKIIRHQFAQAGTQLRNDKAWNTLNNTVSHNQSHYACTLVPASNMKLGADDIFVQSYAGKGVCSSSTSEAKHAVNLWSSEISVPDKEGKPVTLFKGLRHAILSPFGMKKSDPTRQAGALARAKEVATAALYAKPELLKSALAGQTVPLQIVSTALVTATKIIHEDTMLDDQMNAWQALSKTSPVSLSIRGENGKLQEVKVNLGVAAFNFGVNELALQFGMGWSASDKHNAKALEQLIGGNAKTGAPPGGMVGAYLKSNPANAAKVLELTQQLQQIMANNAHHRDSGEPYKAPQRIAMLAYEIGAVPCWNCKSGKDRTGMLDAEIKREAISHHQGQPLSQPGKPLDANNKKIFQQVLIGGGNHEIQAQNTSASGNKVLKNIPLSAINLSYDARVGDHQVWKETQGLSKLV